MSILILLFFVVSKLHIRRVDMKNHLKDNIFKERYENYLLEKRVKKQINKKLTKKERAKFLVSQKAKQIKKSFTFFDKEDLERVESFNESIKRQELSEKDLKDKYNEFNKRSILYLVFSVILLILNTAVFLGNDYSITFSSINLILFNIFIFILFYQQRFYCYQIHKRELNNLTRFLKDYRYHFRFFKK